MNIKVFPEKYKYISQNKRLLARYDKVNNGGYSTFDYVAVDVNGDKSLIKEIITFFEKGKIYSRFFLENGTIKRTNSYYHDGDILCIKKQTDDNNEYRELYKPIYINRKKKQKKAIICKRIIPKFSDGDNYTVNFSFTEYPIAQ